MNALEWSIRSESKELAVQPGISLSMIVRDEEVHLGRILSDAASICDEIVVVDTGSVDRTVEIARNFGAKVYSFEWINNFAAARNYSLALCTYSWVLWLDADDRIPAPSQGAMRALRDEIIQRDDIDGVIIPYMAEFAPDNPNLCRVSVNRERFFRNGIGLQWKGVIHETVPIPPQRCITRTDAVIEHRPNYDRVVNKVDRNLKILQDAVAGGDNSPMTRFYLANELAARDRQHDAVAIFEDMLTLPMGPDEKYDTLCSLAECAASIGDFDKQVATLTSAIAVDPNRPKAFLLLGVYYYQRGAWAQAMPFFAAATVIGRPAHSAGLLFEPAYSWFPWDYLAVCAAQLGKFEQALAYTSVVIDGHPERDRIVSNARFFIEQIDKERSSDEIKDLMIRLENE